MFDDISSRRGPANEGESRDHREGASHPCLAELEAGVFALVGALNGMDRVTREKLSTRGLVPGATLTVLKRGDPMLLRIDDARWAISRSDACHVQVERIDKESSDSPFRKLLRRMSR